MQTQWYLPQTPNTTIYVGLRAPLQEALQHGGWITFALQDTKSSCHVTVKVMGSNGK